MKFVMNEIFVLTKIKISQTFYLSDTAATEKATMSMLASKYGEAEIETNRYIKYQIKYLILQDKYKRKRQNNWNCALNP